MKNSSTLSGLFALAALASLYAFQAPSEKSVPILLDLWPESKTIGSSRVLLARAAPCWFLHQERAPDPSRRVPEALTVANLAGAAVARIVVKQYDANVSKYPSTSATIERRLQRVWSAKPEKPSSSIPWAEAFHWQIAAVLEFAGSDKRGCLATDGHHVYVRDVEGHSWFTRVSP